MERLEDQMLAKIFRLVPREDELKLFRVCKRWNNLMDNFVGIRVTVGRSTEKFNSDEPADSVITLGKVGIRSCKAYCLLNETGSLPKLKNPDLLKFLSFKNFVSSQSFTSILTGVQNLHTFEIDLKAIFHLEFSDIKFSLPCQVLEIKYSYGQEGFHTDCFQRCHRKKSEYEVLNINIIYFFRNSFPGLKKMTTFLLILEHTYDWLTNEIVNFLCKHSTTLTELKIFIWENRISATDYEYNALPKPTPLELQPNQAAQFTNLRRFHLEDQSKSSHKTLDWMGWAMKMLNLKTPNPNRNIYSIILQSPISEKNEALISRISIQLQRLVMNTFNCVIFKDCFRLTYLQIWTDSCRRYGPQDEAFYEGLLNADQLPKTIVKLLISGLAITCETCEVLCLELPALENLELRLNASSNSNGYGVPREVAEKIIQQKNIKKFDFEVGTRLVQGSLKELDEAYAFKIVNRRVIGNLENNGEYKLEIMR